MSETAFSTTQKLQWLVSDPAGSAWVSANAGSGKTHVLTQRVLRLLLAGTDPASILCLTYTKAASAEMGRRIFHRLGQWAVIPPAELKQELRALQGKSPDAAAMKAARTLFARALETPGGLKIQTMHAFCESLLHRFPFEANVPGHFQVVDEPGSEALLNDARETVFAALGEEGTPLREALNLLIARISDARLLSAVADLVKKRGLIDAWVARSAPDHRAGTIGDVFDKLRESFSLQPDDTPESVAQRFFEGHEFQLVEEFSGILLEALDRESGSANDTAAVEIEAILAAGSHNDRAKAVIAFYLKKDLQVRKASRRVTAAAKACIDDFDAIFDADAQKCLLLLEDLNILQTVEATEALLTLGSEILRLYRAAKDRLSLLDYDDLIARTSALLSHSEAAAWVLYKLDSRIDHILLDEAQDTSPAQWSIIQALAEDFFAGETASQKLRTIFAVGDDKQSIYSFQGAAPRMLADMERHFTRRAVQADRTITRQSLFLSFRSTRQVLEAVDAVFAKDTSITESVTSGVYSLHSDHRTGERGRVVIWPRPVAVTGDPPDDWTQAYDAPTEVEKRLAESIAGEIRRLLDEEKVLPSGKSVRSGEILILVRKRDAFFVAMNRALRSAGIATAGSDRIAVSTHIAVLDCLALADVVLLPEDDLQLAACLKSPLIGLDDDDLIILAPGRDGTLWQSLAGSAAPSHQAAYERLAGWRAMADRITPFHFFSRVLGPAGGRAALRARLGSEADDVLDAFLSQALAYERLEPPSLQGFMAHIRAQTSDLKRDSDERAANVRIMTVHGAKGLEADIVFLADTGSRIVNTSRAEPLLQFGDPAAPALVMRQSGERASRIEKNHAEFEVDRATDEYRRLLYVGMTRARDLLYVCGIRRAQTPEDCWYGLVANALLPDSVERNDEEELAAPFVWPEGPAPAADGSAGPQPSSGEPDAPEAPATAVPELPLAPGRPAWLNQPAPPSPHVPEPLRPSGALAEPDPPAGNIASADGADLNAESMLPGGLSAAMRRGQVIHSLLQYLPELPDESRAGEANEWLMQHHGDAQRYHAGWLAEAQAVLDHPELAAAFGPGSRAEVPVVGHVETATGRHAVSGQIDRLLIDGRRARIFDFKTDRQIPDNPEAIDPAYIAQLALYRRLVGRIVALGAPARDGDVAAVLVWTAGPVIMPVAAGILDDALAHLGILQPSAA